MKIVFSILLACILVGCGGGSSATSGGAPSSDIDFDEFEEMNLTGVGGSFVAVSDLPAVINVSSVNAELEIDLEVVAELNISGSNNLIRFTDKVKSVEECNVSGTDNVAQGYELSCNVSGVGNIGF